MKPQIIAEKYMVDESGYELKDYKFFTFDGKVNRYVLDDKLLLPLFCEGIANVRTPKTFLTIYNNIWFDENKNLISKQQVQNYRGGMLIQK